MSKKIFFLFLIILFLVFVFSPADAQRALEVVYPSIPGIPTPTDVETGLPEYAQYIFRFAIIIIGFIIFGVLIYNGIIYMTSSGNPAKLGEAKTGILAAILGAAVLLGAYLIFTTINPQLIHLETKPLDPLLGIIPSGIYVCDDNGKAQTQDNISGKIEDYIRLSELESPEDADKQIEVVREIREIMSKHGCPRLSFSGNFQNFKIKKDKNTFFAIPDRKREQGKWVYDVYNYGLILHQKDRHGGMAALIEPIYDKIRPFPEIDFTAHSFTVFQKPLIEPNEERKGVILYACMHYNNDPDACVKPEDVQIFNSFKTPGRDFAHYGLSLLGELAENTRSIQIDPVDGYFAILFRDEHFTGQGVGGTFNKAEVFNENDENLQDNQIGQCGAGCNAFIRGFLRIVKECLPCVKSIIVIKGNVL